MSSVQVYSNDCFDSIITFEDGLPYFHVDVKQDLTREDIKLGREVFKEVKKSLVQMGFPRLYAYTPKIGFARLFGPGFVHIEEIKTEDQTFDVIVWELLEVTDGS